MWEKWKGRCCSFPVLYSDLLRAHQLKLDKLLHVKPPGKICLLTEMVLGMLFLSFQYWTNTFPHLQMRASVLFELSHLLLTHPRNRKVQFSILAKCFGILTENNILFRNGVLFLFQSFGLCCYDNAEQLWFHDGWVKVYKVYKVYKESSNSRLLMEYTKVHLTLSDLNRGEDICNTSKSK